MDADEMDLGEARNLIHAGKIAEGGPAGIRAGDGCPACHYCDVPLGKARHEHDHAPVPTSEGGTRVVPACLTCHEFKDRARIEGLPRAEYAAAVRGLLDRGLLAAATLGDPPVDWPAEWPTMTRWERITWAAIVRVAHQAAGSDVVLPDDTLGAILHLSPA